MLPATPYALVECIRSPTSNKEKVSVRDNSSRPAWWAILICVVVSGVALVLAGYVWKLSNQVHHSFSLVDSTGKERVRMRADDDGGRIELVDRDGSSRVAILQTGDDISIELKAGEAHARSMRLVVSEKAESSILLRGDDGKSKAQLAVAKTEGAGLFASTGYNGVSLYANETQGTDLTLSRVVGKIRRSATINLTDDWTRFSMTGSHPFFSVVQLKEDSRLELASPEGKSALKLTSHDQLGSELGVSIGPEYKTLLKGGEVSPADK